MANDPILDAPMTPAYPVGYTFWITNWHAIESAARQWYLEAHGHSGADTDIAHGLWRGLNECDRWQTLRNAWQNTWPKPGDIPGPIPPNPIPPTPQPLPNAGEHGEIHVDGFVFRRDDGSIYPWAGADSFLIVDKIARGKQDFIQQVLTEVIDPDGSGQCVGANLIRAFATLDWRNQTGPQFDGGVGPLIGVDRVQAMKDTHALCSSRGLRVEFSFGDLVKIMPNQNDRVNYIQEVRDAFRSAQMRPFFEFNEPGHVDQVSPEEAVELGRILMAAGLLVSFGIYDIPTGTTDIPYGSYCTVHDERKDEWPREPRDCSNFYQGWDWLDAQGNVIGHFNGCPVPWVDDESMGGAEVAIPGRRSDSPDDFAWYGATAALLASGATIHFDNGVCSNLLQPVQKRSVIEFGRAMHFVPAEAKLANYQRGAAEQDGGGFGPGVGNMPIAHFDLNETGKEPRALRSFCKLVDGTEYCVAIRATQEKVTPRDGWRVEAEPRRGLVRLIR